LWGPVIWREVGGQLHGNLGRRVVDDSILLFASIAYFILTKVLIAHQGAGSILAASIGADRKGAVSVAVYLVAIPVAFVLPWVACACYVMVAVMWFIPDRRIEKTLAQTADSD
jgi:uncharacterized membrane protein